VGMILNVDGFERYSFQEAVKMTMIPSCQILTRNIVWAIVWHYLVVYNLGGYRGSIVVHDNMLALRLSADGHSCKAHVFGPAETEKK